MMERNMSYSSFTVEETGTQRKQDTIQCLWANDFLLLESDFLLLDEFTIFKTKKNGFHSGTEQVCLHVRGEIECLGPREGHAACLTIFLSLPVLSDSWGLRGCQQRALSEKEMWAGRSPWLSQEISRPGRFVTDRWRVVQAKVSHVKSSEELRQAQAACAIRLGFHRDGRGETHTNRSFRPLSLSSFFGTLSRIVRLQGALHCFSAEGLIS